MGKYFCYFFVVLTFFACSRYPAEVEWSLKLAGDNRAELEKVLAHYQKQPTDSLKYKAACYLVGNMPQHFSYRSAKIETFKTVSQLSESKQISMNEAYAELVSRHGKLSYTNAKKVYDMHVITSDFLINNIELAFRAWQEMPYGKHYGFRDFCEYVLPYRVMNEPLENWRKLYFDTFMTITDTIAHPEDPVYVAQVFNDYVIERGFKPFYESIIPEMGAVMLWNDPFGGCREKSVLTAFFLRSVGIPCGVDIILKRPDLTGGRHYMSFLKDTTLQPILFESLDSYNKLKRGINLEYKFGKIYRASYTLQKESLPYKAHRGTYIPPTLYHTFMDASTEYMAPDTITIEPRRIPSKSTGKRFYFLSVFDFHGWVPVDWTVSDNGKATFRNVQNEIVYTVLTHDGEKLVPASNPFILSGDKVRFIQPDHEHPTDMHIERKYPMRAIKYLQMSRMIGGLFQAANREDFSDADLLWRINDFQRYCFHYVDLPPSGKKYRYFRYVTPADTIPGFVGEIEALDRDGIRIEATRVFGTEGTATNPLENIYDGDPLTYYVAAEAAKPVWAAVDFGEPREIGSISYICCNDDNSVRVGDQYELFYWDEGWHSLGSRTGDKNHVLVFNSAPSNTLYWLRNRTRGIEERIFIYENEEQIFY